MFLRGLVTFLLAFSSVVPALAVLAADAQESGEFRETSVSIIHESYDREDGDFFLETVTGQLTFVPQLGGSFEMRGNGSGVLKWDQSDAFCEDTGTLTFPALIEGLIGPIRNGTEITGYQLNIQAFPGQSMADMMEFEREYTVQCYDEIRNERWEEPRRIAPVPLVPQILLKKNMSSWQGEEGYAGETLGSITKVSLSPPDFDAVYRVFGTIKDAKGKPMAESKVVLGDLDAISGGALPLQMLSQSTPDFEQETAAANNGHFEFELERSYSDPLRAAVVSLLWYEGEGQLAVTSGPQVGGRFIPIYQVACIDHFVDSCVKWEKTADGFEAQVDFSYGFDSSGRHAQVMAQEPWNTEGRDIGLVIRDASIIYTNSYKAIKYFESVKGTVGNPLNPVMIDIYNSHSANCKDDSGRDKDNAFFDYQARDSFGLLGTYLESEKAVGGTVTICTKTSRESQPDAPINREYHELGHYLQNDMYYPSSNVMAGRGTPHDGYKNGGTNDSFVEGFAEFAALLVAEHHRELEGGEPIYPFSKNLEIDYRVWHDNVRVIKYDNGTVVARYYPDLRSDEEFAVAGLLWDLHDTGRPEFHVSHKIGANEDLSELWAPISHVYNVTKDNVALFGEHILDNIRSSKPMNLVDLYRAFSSDVSAQDLDMIFINHGAFGDVSTRDLVHGPGESVGHTGSSDAPARSARLSPQTKLNGSYISSESDAIFEVKFAHREPYSFYDYSYDLNMTKGTPAYFEMPPSYYPSVAQFLQVSPDGKISGDSSLTINSTEYWNYIYSHPEESAIFKTVEIAQEHQPVVPISQDDESTGSVPSQPSGCLIATAAFGSELTPQVQFLRNFRDNHILSTASGTSFMNVFNAWYYSFSPQVADYEREQPWLQQTVRVGIYPLLGVLQTAEKAYAIVPGEFGSVFAGLVASSLIGAVYLSPVALLVKQVRRGKSRLVLYAFIMAAVTVAVAVSLLINSPQALMVSTASFVIAAVAISAVLVARMVSNIIGRIRARL